MYLVDGEGFCLGKYGLLTLDPINTTVGIYHHDHSYFKISNNKRTFLVYKDLEPIRDTLDDEIILDSINNMLYNNKLRLISFKSKVPQE